MYFQLSGQKWNRFNQSLFLRLTRNVEPRSVARAVGILVKQHPMLRARFKKTESGRWNQFISKEIEGSYRFSSYDTQSPEGMKASMESSQGSINVEGGPVFAVDMFNIEGEGHLLFLAAHHLVIDLMSWRVILHDLEQILETGILSSEAPFPFQAWSNLQAEYASQSLTPAKVLPFEMFPVDYQSYWGMEGKENFYEDTSSQNFELSSDITSSLLGSCQNALRTKPVELFMATLLQSFGRTFTDRQTPIVFSEGHGRESWTSEVDVSDTVGWFTTMAPLQIELQGEGDIVDILRRTKDNRRKLPGHGWPYFTSRFLNEEGKEAFNDHVPMELLFNYLGRYQQLERKDGLLRQEVVDAGMLASDVGIRVPRLALFEVSIAVVHGATRFTIGHNRHTQRQSDITRWVQAWEQSLIEAAQRLSYMRVEPTLSDFPLLPLTYQSLEKLKNEQLPQIGLTSFSDIEDIYPCSPMQQGLLLSQVRESGNYEVDFTYEVFATQNGKVVEVDRLVSAWQQVVNRHSMLRTIFIDSVCDKGLSDQLVLKNFSASTIQTSCDQNDDDAVMALFNAKPALNHTASNPRHQITVCTTSSRRVFVRLEINHAIIDAASVSVVLQDWVLAYEGRLQPGSGPLYGNYIKFLQDRPVDISMEYWKEYLEGVNPCYFPKLDYYQNSKTKELRSVKEKLHTQQNSLGQFCSTHGVTAANVVQTIWGLVLASYTSSDEICFGYLSSGRDMAVEGVDQIVGPLINMLVCRMRFSDVVDMSELVRQVQGDYLAALEHRHCSLAQIQHGLDLSSQPLFNTILSVQQAMAGSVQSKLSLLFSGVGGHDPTEVSTKITSPLGFQLTDIFSMISPQMLELKLEVLQSL
jgi:non-ribosomal peptide synthase protein (TIGR01720 family)